MEGTQSCFGVGCFHFAPRDLTQTFDPFEFSEDIGEVLESIPMVSNLDWKGVMPSVVFLPIMQSTFSRVPG